MATSHRFIRPQRLGLSQQRARMMMFWPMLDSRIEAGWLVARGVLQPAPITRAYRVAISYREYDLPTVRVVAPQIVRRPQEPDIPIPHTYEALTPGKERPCVYYPAGREWTSAMPLATTIVPWLLAWLVDYEIWYGIGEWLGGGVAHNGTDKTEDDVRFSEDGA